MTERQTLRASDSDREEVAQRLRQAATEGRLHTEELEDRVATALSARTYGELDALVADLPVAPIAPRKPAGSPVAWRSRVPVPVPVAIAVAVMLAAVVASALDGSHHHSGIWDGAPLIWLVWLAVGWRFLAHRHHGTR